MKALLVIVGLLLAAGAGAVGGVLVTSCPSQTPPVTEVIVPMGAHAAADRGAERASAALDDHHLSAQIDALSAEVSQLQSELARLREGPTRVSAVAVATEKKAPIDDNSAAFAALHRDAIMAVIAQDREELARKAEEERKQQQAEQMAQRADRIGKKVGLSPDQQKSLTDLYVQERTKIDELRGNMRDPAAWQDNPEGAREAFRAMRDWHTTELTNRFGADLAAKINEQDGGFRGPGGAGVGGGQGAGGNAGRRANRGNDNGGNQGGG